MQGDITNKQNQANGATGALTQTPASGVSNQIQKSSSPWEEDVEIPEENSKKSPQIIGTLGPELSGSSKPFVVPSNVEEKVGKTIPAESLIGTDSTEPQKAQALQAPQAKQVMQATQVTQATAIEPSQLNSSSAIPVTPVGPTNNQTDNSTAGLEDFDWFGDGTEEDDGQPVGVIPNEPINESVVQNKTLTDEVSLQQTGQETGRETSKLTEQVAGQVASQEIKTLDIKKPAPQETKNSILNNNNLSGAQPNNSLVQSGLANLDAKTLSPSLGSDQAPVGSGLATKKSKMNFKGVLNIKTVIISVLSLIFLCSAVVALTEFGVIGIGAEKVYGSIGLEKLWGGLSTEPDQALFRSLVAMKEHPNFKIKGEAEFTVDYSIQSEVTSNLINDAKSLGLSDTKGISKIATELNVVTNEKATKAEIKLQTGLGGSLSLLNNNEKIYYNNDKNSSGDWIQYTIGSLVGKTAQEEVFRTNSNSGLSISGERLGGEKVGGEQCFHYKIDDLVIGHALEGIGITPDMVQSVNGDVWIGVKTKLIRKVNLNVALPTSSSVSMVALNINLYDFDVKNNIESAPNGNIVSGVKKTGDEKRKDDIAKILSALEVYKAENGTYPNTGNQVVPLSESGNMLEVALVPKYLPSLPKDDNSLYGWYYAYKSDGLRSSMSSRLEKTDDPEGQMINNVILYIRYNSD